MHGPSKFQNLVKRPSFHCQKFADQKLCSLKKTMKKAKIKE